VAPAAAAAGGAAAVPVPDGVFTKPPFVVGNKLLAVASFDQRPHAATVVAVRGEDEGPGGAFDEDAVYYYCHYVGHDRRLDEWVRRRQCQMYSASAEQEVSPRAAAEGKGEGTGARRATRNLKRRYEQIHNVAGNLEDLPEIDQKLEKEHEENTKVKYIQTIHFGRFELDTWYYSPYPAEYGQASHLYVCEHSLKYFKHRQSLLAHRERLLIRNPPGDEIYRGEALPPGAPGAGKYGAPAISMFEVDGARAKLYCQNLCLFAKLFLDHKTLYFDVEPFLFYVMCERTPEGEYELAGYFSKEKNNPLNENNLACILALPTHQRKGYGSFLISFSYELSRCEGKVGTPERPLSDLGKVSYRSFWRKRVIRHLASNKGSISIQEVAETLAMLPDDVVETLQDLGLVSYWRGQHIVNATSKVIEEHCKLLGEDNSIQVQQDRLIWTPRMWPPNNN
jgi:histone acetyltransferase MYST1